MRFIEVTNAVSASSQAGLATLVGRPIPPSPRPLVASHSPAQDMVCAIPKGL